MKKQKKVNFGKMIENLVYIFKVFFFSEKNYGHFYFFISKDKSLDENLSFGFFFIKIGALESTFIRGFLPFCVYFLKIIAGIIAKKLKR